MDNASANEKEINYLKKTLRIGVGICSFLNDFYLHARCSAHITNLIVKNLDVVDLVFVGFILGI